MNRYQFEVLTYIEKNGKKEYPMRTLSDTLKISGTAISKALDELENEALIKRCEDQMEITERGLEALEPYRVKRAVIMAAGFGSRMVPVTLDRPKPMVAVNGVRIIDTLLDALVSVGIKDITLVRGYKKEKFDEILEKTHIPRAAGGTVFTAEEAKEVANRLGYPVLVRPSYVLGGQGMKIAFNDEEIEEFIGIINRIAQDHPILVDKYLQGKEIEVDAVCDGTDILIPGIMEHIERTGIHSGDSISVYPAPTIDKVVKEKIAEYTRYLTVGLALFESCAMAVGLGGKGLLLEDHRNIWGYLTVVAAMTAGSALLMWIGERITEKGVGNGISIVLMINILSRVPSDITTLYETFIKPQTVAKGALAAVIILAVIVVTVVLVILLNGATRNIPVQYAKKMQGRKMVGGQSSSIPLKVNTAGVIPVIFASSLMSMPSIIAAFMGRGNGNGIGSKILKGLSQQNWFSLSNPVYTLGFVLYAVMIVFFAYFYTSITFNPIEVADNMKKQGGFIPGIRPGKPTQDYLEKILNYIIFIGAIGLLIVCTIPIVFNGAFGASVSFGGTSIIIIVGVVLETLKQIESQMLVRNYRGFLSE